jgi:beta-mannosidase
VDANWAFRFGPPAQDAIVASLEGHDDGGEGRERDRLLSQSVHFPAGRPLAREPAARLGLHANARKQTDERVCVAMRTRRLAYGVRVHVPGFIPSEDAFCIEPGAERNVQLLPRTPDTVLAEGWLTAVNLRGRIPVQTIERPSVSPRAGVPSLPLGASEDGAV